ncbi:MAG TPA: hypothetical protein VFA10_18095 [Ktedonobacteraceae bacterium]|nr:hypothetical protein [Ktedonobacteraceae bacterium]
MKQNSVVPPGLQLLKMAQVEDMLNLSRETIRAYMHRPVHPLPYMRVGKNGYGLRFNAAKLAQWCEEEEARSHER